MADHPESAPADGPKKRVQELERTLAAVHRELIVVLRREYEAAGGQVEGPLQLLDLVEHDPAFSWIAPLTTLLLAVGDGDRGATTHSVEALFNDTRALFESQAPDDFAARYTERLQREFDLLAAHRDLRAVLGK